MSEPIIVTFVTLPTKDSAFALAEKILDCRLAACVNILPEITSVYHWQGKREASAEVLLLIKTRLDLFEDLRNCIEKNHPYEVPEILALSTTAISEPYARWVMQETAPSPCAP